MQSDSYRYMMNMKNKHSSIMIFLFLALTVFTTGNLLQAAEKSPLRIMPLGDSITAGYTDNPKWQHPFNFGYRSGLYTLLTEAGYKFQFVGESPEPWDGKWRVPSNKPSTDLRRFKMDKHRGYGGWSIGHIQRSIEKWLKKDRPDIILLMIGINGMNENSPKQLDFLVKTIFETDKDVNLIVAQITPLARFSQSLFDYNTYIKDIIVPSYAKEGRTIRTVDLYSLFLSDKRDPKSIDATRLSNRINHPTSKLYDKMAESWFKELKKLLKLQIEQGGVPEADRLRSPLLEE